MAHKGHTARSAALGMAAGVAAGIRGFAAQLRGFDLPDGVLTAVESRTSAPVRIMRFFSGMFGTTIF